MKDRQVQKQFGKHAEKYVTSELHAKGADLYKLVSIAGLTGKEVVLDIATGGGHVANALAPQAKSVVALDLTTNMLEAAKGFLEGNGRTNVTFVQGNAESLPFESGTFDIVTCRIAAHHFPNVKNFVQEASRVLKQDGTFLFIDNVVPESVEFDQFYNEVEKQRDPSHFRAWKKSEWIGMMEEVGFEIHEWYRFEKTFKFDNWCERMGVEEDVQQAIAEQLLSSSSAHYEKFRIRTDEGKVVSFQGESVLVKAKKINL